MAEDGGPRTPNFVRHVARAAVVLPEDAVHLTRVFTGVLPLGQQDCDWSV